MNNEAINRLRVPAAWALLGAVVAQVIAGLIHVFASSDYENAVSSRFVASGDVYFFGPVIIALLLGAVLLVATAPRRTSVNFPIVLTALILTGFAALMALVTLVMGFVLASDTSAMSVGFSNLFAVGGQLAIVAIAGLFMVKVFNDQNLVPRSAPQQVGPQQTFGPHAGVQQGFAPQTGSQASFAQQGYGIDAQQAYQQQDWAAQQEQQGYGYAAPNQNAYADAGQAAYGDQGQQAYAADPAQQAQQGYVDPSGYGQSWQQNPSGGQDASYYQQGGAQDGYAQQSYQAGYTQTGGQQAYGQEWQSAEQQAQAYGTGGQQAYGQQVQTGYDAYGTQQPQAYGTGAQQAYGTGGQQAYASGGQPVQAYDTGAQQGYAADPNQQAYATGGQQAAYGSAYDPGQYAAQPQADVGQVAQPGDQYGWYQQAEQQQQQDAGAAAPAPADQGYGAQYGSGSAYGQPYGSDQLGQSGAESPDGQQNWYRDDDRR
ncbi:hypothetical protein CDO52_24240 [Nocardiopsis gilva YIM 90087]|uniref:Uncharacterized protein n=1 Tax=Nocardiopsis gilva YIM 90087 TaxID=1235441 RepID=A0A223SBF1_9ACTN|nr:hypothetical protein [Nocardiopsis gilva]ASU85494.1 hypothetical protein CDO52_24240 [Nocardiopsis gilva YIM 90087]